LLIDEAAVIARVSPATIRYWIATKRLKSVRPGRRRMIREDDLLAFLEGR
jgi:excisionase family DNA binding protein